VLKRELGAGWVVAGLFDLWLASERDSGLVIAQRLLAAGQTVMVQPYLERIEADGEAALIFFGGEFSHVINKGAMLTTARKVVADLYTEEVITPRVASPDEMTVARAALAAIPGGADQIAYARVDLVPGPGGEPLLIELELTEPSLFLGKAPGSADRLARHLFDRASRR
jgi:glutathione synthase/RimK-type ligase-like ATP-grasp enzyme